MSYVDVINGFIGERRYVSYLEISSSGQCNMDGIRCDSKVSVNPDPRALANFTMDSDTFFVKYPIYKGIFDVIFIDGVHLYENVIRDIRNSLSFLSKGGIIVIHDCIPATEQHASRDRSAGVWNGDVWKAVAEYFSESEYSVYTYDVDFGCAVIDTSKTRSKPEKTVYASSLTWDDYSANKRKLLNIVPYVRKSGVKVNYTAYLVNGWEQLFTRHMRLLKSSVLGRNLSNLSIFAYPRNIKLFSILDELGIPANVSFSSGNMYEFPAVRDIVYNRSDINLYFHTKSITRTKDRNCACWERYLTEFNINRAGECIRGLDTYDCVGTEFRKTPFIHYSGNFWWARGSHLEKLQGSSFLSDSACSSGFRHACERLICSVDGSYLSLRNSGSKASLYNDYFCNAGDWEKAKGHSFYIKDGILSDPDNAAV